MLSENKDNLTSSFLVCMKVKVKLLIHARLFATPWTVACTKLLCPWDFQGKSTGVGCHFLPQKEKEISPKYSLEGLMLKLKLQYFVHLMQTTDSLEKSLMLGKIEGRMRRG